MEQEKRIVTTYRAGVVDTEALKRLASFEALNKSEAVRLAIREAAQRRGLWQPGDIIQRNENVLLEVPEEVSKRR